MRHTLSRTAEYLQTLTLDSQARMIKREGLTYLSAAKIKRLGAAIVQVRKAGVPGAFVEFGVALGGSGILLASAAQGRQFHGFDVFQEIPPPTSSKDDEKSKQRYAVIKAGKSRGLKGKVYYGYRSDLFGDVVNAFARYGVPIDGQSTSLHKGLFQDTWPSTSIDKIALAHVDCDWYEPVAFCLQAVADRLSAGGIIVLDDYYDYGGCRTATREFLAQRSEFTFEDGKNPFLRKRGVA